MRAAPVLLLLLCAWPLWAAGATYKCTLNGKTSYQQSPCSEAAQAQGGAGEVRIAPKADPGSFSASDTVKRKELLSVKGPPVARAAFGYLVSGQIDVYVANLCPRDRAHWSNPVLKQSLKATGLDLARRKAQFGRTTDTGLSDMSFVALEDPYATSASGRPIKTLKVNASFDWDLGQICLRAMTVFEGS